MSMSEVEALIAQAEQVEKQQKERKRTFTPGPLYDVQIPKWGQSKRLKYHIGGDEVSGDKMLAVIVGSHHTFIRWGHKDHDTKKGPLCQVRGYFDPVTGEKVDQSDWEIPRPTVDMTITTYKPFGSQKTEGGDFLSCADCRTQGKNKSTIPTKFGGEDKCESDGYLDIVVFRHMVQTEEGNLYKVVNQTKVGSAYMAKLPLTAMAQTKFMNFVFDLAKIRKLSWKDVLVQFKVEEEKIKSGAMVATMDFSEMDPEKKQHQDAVNESKQLYTTKVEEAKAKYAAEKGQNPVAQTSGGNPSAASGDGVPFETGKSY